MKFSDRIKRLLGLADNNTSPDLTLKEVQQTVFKKGRQSLEFDDNYQAGFKFLPRRIYADFDATAVFESKSLSYAQILAILPDLDPDVSMALHNTLRLANTDMTVTVYKGTKTEVVDQVGQDKLDSFLPGINKHYGGINNLRIQLFMAAYLQGAMSLEAVLDDATKKVIDIVPVNPFSIHFLHVGDGSDIAPTQYQLKPGTDRVVVNANYVVMNPLTFWYSPVDPSIGDPYGRSPAAAAISDVMFMMKIMFDLRKVIHNQGWPRIDVTIITEMLENMAPDEIKNDPNKYAEFITEQSNKILSAYQDLKPDDTFVHNDAVKLAMVGETSKGALMDPSALLLSIERRIIRGLKQLPMLMGSNEGTTETHGTVQYEIYTKSIESFQTLEEEILEDVFELYLRMEGMQCTVEVEFAKVRSSQRMLDAQAEQMEIQNEIAKRDQGWISNEEASMNITESAPFMDPDEMDEDEPDEEEPDGNGEIDTENDPTDPANIDPNKKPAPAAAGDEVVPTPKKTKPDTSKNKSPKVAPAEVRVIRNTGAVKKINDKQRTKYDQGKDQYRVRTKKAFAELQQQVPNRELVQKVLDAYPQTPKNMLQGKRALARMERGVDINSPVYQTIVDIVGTYFDTEETKKIVNELSADAVPLLISAFENYGSSVLDRIATVDANMTYTSFKLNDQGLVSHIAQRAEADTRSSFETAQGDIARKVMEGYSNNDSLGKIGTDLRGLFADLKTSRSELIAHQEMNFASSLGAITTMKNNGVQQKEWQTVEDDRVREEHMANEDAGPIGINDTFPGTGEDSAPSADFNCRCVMLEVLDENWAAPDTAWTGGDDFSNE